MPSSSSNTTNSKTILPVHHHRDRDSHASTISSPDAAALKNSSSSHDNNSSHPKQYANNNNGYATCSNEDSSSSLSHDDNNNEGSSNNNNNNNKYANFPLVQSMIAAVTTRTSALTNEGAKQMLYPKSNTGWARTLFTWEGRALDRILLPWSIATLNAIIWAILYETTGLKERLGVYDLRNLHDNINDLLNLVLSMTLAFLLVFRLNRSATRFWMARGCWGIVVVKIRSIVGTVLVYGSHDPYHRDNVIKWAAAFSIASMNFTRGIKDIDPETVAGVLTREELDDLVNAVHPPLHAADRIRFHLSELFAPVIITDTTDDGENRSSSTTTNAKYLYAVSVSDLRTNQLISLEQQLNVMIDEEGAMERIKGTPLPLVYVTHLRTWLMLYLLTMPYFWEEFLGYATILVVFLTAFAMLGLEGAAEEVESPFRKDRTNHLDMNSFCLTVMSNVLQQIKEDADRRSKRRKKV